MLSQYRVNRIVRSLFGNNLFSLFSFLLAKSVLKYCVYPKYMAIGLNLYLGSQSICFAGFWVSYYGCSYARQTQIYFCFLVPFSLPNGITPLLSLSIYTLFLVLFSDCQPPFPHSHLLFIAQDQQKSYDYSRLLVGLGV